MNGYRDVLRRLWDGRCSIFVREAVVNEANGQTDFVERMVAHDLPCRLSYRSIVSTSDTQGAAKVAQSAKLFLDEAVEVPPGSKLRVTQKGVTRDYSRSGESAVYSTHQEVPLELFERWA